MTPLPQKHRNEANKFSISQTDVNKKRTIKQIATTLIKTTTYQGKKHNVFLVRRNMYMSIIFWNVIK
jgi:hypothetical protein